MKTPAEILYRPRGRFRSNRVGAHASSAVGGVGVFRDQAPFLRYPDARRIDLHATLRDPFGETHVRRFEQRSAIDLYAIVDVSASMGFVGAVDRFAVVYDICAALAFSATRIGDRFGLIAGGVGLSDDLFLPATRSRSAAMRAVERLGSIGPSGAHAGSLVGAAARLCGGRKLILLISDFRWPTPMARSVFDALAGHDVLPVVLVDSFELDPPRWGLLELQDPETACARLMVLRPGLVDEWKEAEAKRREELIRLAAGRVRRPLFVEDAFDPSALCSRLMDA
jgi:uncharacterized protein (DUF58 family)